MKIFMDNNIKHRVGRRLSKAWEAGGHKVFSHSIGGGVQLCFTRCYTKTNLPIVQRLDGIYYDLDLDYNRRNRGHKMLHAVADGIIYQSEYSRKMCVKFFGKPRTKIWSVVHNGVPERWRLPKVKHDGFNIVSASKWRRHKRLPEIIEVFQEFHKDYPDSKLHIMGKIFYDKDKPLLKLPGVQYYGMLTWGKMRKIYAECDAFIHIAKRYSCPNSVVEAIGSGLPVITSNGCGGGTEMCELTDGCIICEGDEKSYDLCRPYSEEHNKLSKKLKTNLLNGLEEIYKDRRVVDIPRQLTMKHMADDYIKVFKRVLKERGK